MQGRGVRAGAAAVVGAAVMLLLAACATPEARLRTGLVNAGMNDAMARCMASEMIDDLSLIQLRRLASLGSLRDQPVTDMTAAQFARKVRALKDPEIWAITVSAGTTCAFR